MKLSDLQTPCLILDKSRVERNCARMSARAATLGVALRPHMKTGKSAEIAKIATAGQTDQTGKTGGVTVSTLAEAEYLFEHGFADILYAVSIPPSKLDRAAALTARGADLKILIDSVEVAEAIAAHPGTHAVMIEVDCGEHRTGVDHDNDRLIAIARILDNSPRARLAGVMTHAGHSYRGRTPEDMQAVASVERDAAVAAAELIRADGIACPIVSVGSTPTALYADHLDGVTEMRPGVYTLGDLFQAGIGSHGIDDIASSVVASVISHNKARGTLILDAGGIALSKDRSTEALGKDGDKGFGLLADLETGRPLHGLTIRGTHQEHGEVHLPDPALFETLPIGARVRVLPNHVCMTVAAHEIYEVFEEGSDEIIARWDRRNGW
ncbi:alanine racemase [Nisaea sp.]|uniref:alanine racemase n=1 Tax=Nisaea sp. TaxID=2024842 RepID=UPI002B26E489|nr:alanine racemase [Nisaea sp.]